MNATVLEELHNNWKKDPNSVETSWKLFFQNMENDNNYSPQFVRPEKQPVLSGGFSEKDIQDHLSLMMMIRQYRVRGHLTADLDPLKLKDTSKFVELEIERYGFTEKDLDREFVIGDIADLSIIKKDFSKATLREVVSHLKKCYTRHVGFEYYHISDPRQRAWLRRKIENQDFEQCDDNTTKWIYKYLMKGEIFENYLNTKFGNTKRFGCEGGESMISGISEIFVRASELDIESIVMGMPHRGRLSMLALMGKPIRQIFNDFHPKWSSEDQEEGSGDVKYHLGASTEKIINDKKIKLSMASNPSHLEAVDPIVVGKVRAKQLFLNDTKREKVMGLLIHGDAAFAGQGIVAETLSLSALKNYETGGTIHFIVNNQIGFTTDPESARSCPYPSDVAKMVGAPIFHVNGDDPIAVHNVCKLAVEWRQEFKRDVVIDMFCYRKYGHNEMDEPMFTQPKMYQVIRNRQSTAVNWEKKLLSEHKLTEQECKEMKDEIYQEYEKEFEASKHHTTKKKDWLEGNWSEFKVTINGYSTGYPIDKLKEIGLEINNIPKDFTLHRGIQKIYHDRKESIEKGIGLDWGTGETLAYASLLNEGYHVRISGQDSERGTFSHRHAVLHDQKNFNEYIPLEHVSKNQGNFGVTNSSLSEFAVLGYELGYSLEHPNILVIWEAQFGDFSNGAQVIFDQFISCGERKWYRQSGITILLPHGYDGNGPEHSSARPERFLQMSDENPYKINLDLEKQEKKINMQIVNVSTPANFFHLLRRQMIKPYRKPLIVMTPKKLLKHRLCRSNLNEFDFGTHFKRIIPEHENLEKVEKVIFCTGQIYYDLLEKRSEKKVKNMAIIRIEQLSPFPWDLVQKELEKYSNATFYWVQEEHMNMGYWHYMEPRFNTLHCKIHYIGRDTEAAPATGIKDAHEQQHEQIMKKVFHE